MLSTLSLSRLTAPQTATPLRAARTTSSPRAIGRHQLGAGGLLIVTVTARVIAMVQATMTIAGLATLLGMSMLALAVAISCDETISPVDRFVNQMCRRAGLVQTVIGLVTLAFALL